MIFLFAISFALLALAISYGNQGKRKTAAALYFASFAVSAATVLLSVRLPA